MTAGGDDVAFFQLAYKESSMTPEFEKDLERMNFESLDRVTKVAIQSVNIAMAVGLFLGTVFGILVGWQVEGWLR